MKQGKMKIILVALTVVLLLAVGVFILINRSSPPSYKVPLSPDELMPAATHQQARAAVCGKMSGGFYDQICQREFDNIPKNDDEKLTNLFSFFGAMKDDRALSDYDRYFLAHLIFASLPTKESPMVRAPGLVKIAGEFLRRIVSSPAALADEPIREENMRDFDEQMARDLVSTIYDLPKGDNAWAINVMVSKYAWVDGKRQPIYSEQYAEVFDPFPENPQVKRENITHHIRSFVDSKSVKLDSSQGELHKGTSVMIAYSFTMMSWQSQGYGHDESVPEKKMHTRKSFSEESYNGTNHMDELFAVMERVEKSSGGVVRRRNAAFEDRKNFNADNRRIQTRPRGDTDVLPPASTAPPAENSRFDVDQDACRRAADAAGAECQGAAFECYDSCKPIKDQSFYECQDVCYKQSRACYQARNDAYDACAGGGEGEGAAE